MKAKEVDWVSDKTMHDNKYWHGSKVLCTPYALCTEYRIRPARRSLALYVDSAQTPIWGLPVLVSCQIGEILSHRPS